jgi:2-polyprenyl-6-hydroxyphenyl methylase/3-demethylubiquinone-9 3-methyltransferase
MSGVKTHEQEIKAGERFAFGENWTRFLELLDDDRIRQAEESLRKMLETDSLAGKTFIDVGSGSGLFSLAARRLGAKVMSFDYDPHSVACAIELKRRYFNGDAQWTIEEGSVLDAGYLRRLGQFDVVYSWGVLHHTGQMWQALANVDQLVKQDGGKLFIALYNDQGRASKMWWAIKKAYVTLPPFLRWLVVVPCYVRLWGPTIIKDFLRFKPFHSMRAYKGARGMSPHRDVIDWVGGFPFEVSKPEQVFDFYRARGYTLRRLVTCAGGLGCNELVFQRSG